MQQGPRALRLRACPVNMGVWEPNPWLNSRSVRRSTQMTWRGDKNIREIRYTTSIDHIITCSGGKLGARRMDFCLNAPLGGTCPALPRANGGTVCAGQFTRPRVSMLPAGTPPSTRPRHRPASAAPEGRQQRLRSDRTTSQMTPPVWQHKIHQQSSKT